MNLFLFALVFLHQPASASFVKQKKFDSYQIRLETQQPITIQVKALFSSPDSCNDFLFDGEFRSVEGHSYERTVVADFDVLSTQRTCPPSNSPRKIQMESERYQLFPRDGWIFAKILVPENYLFEVK